MGWAGFRLRLEILLAKLGIGLDDWVPNIIAIACKMLTEVIPKGNTMGNFLLLPLPMQLCD